MLNIAVLSGDGIGNEVMCEAIKILDSVGKFNFNEYPIGGSAIDLYGDPLPNLTIEGVNNSDAVLLGAIGGKQWDGLDGDMRPESGLLRLRKELGVYANIRPVEIYDSILESSPLKAHIVRGADFVIVRELLGGLYFGEPRGKNLDKAYNTMLYSRSEIERIAVYAFNLAMTRRKKLCVVDKANVLETSQLWRDVVHEVHNDYSDVDLSFLYVDNASMQIILNPRSFDVILCENLFGDILSDEASVICGSIGVLASASVGDNKAIFEPIHGSAPDIAGLNVANPIAMILSASMMLSHLGDFDSASKIRIGISKALEYGYRTKDLALYGDDYKVVSCSEMGDVILKSIREI